MDIKGRNFLKLFDFTKDEILNIIEVSKKLKYEKKNNISHRLYEGKNIVLIFEKPSTRTRCAFEVASYDLGIGVTYLETSTSQMGSKESIQDTAKVLSSMYDGIEYRGFSQETVEILGKFSNVPVWNGLTDLFHPTQVIADFLTINENFEKLKGLNLVFLGDARFNMANSLMVGCSKIGINFTACTNKKYFPNKEIFDKCINISKESGAKITLEENIEKAVKDADVIYTDVWVSMGEPKEVWDKRIKDLLPYQVNKNVMSKAKENTLFMHCLPAFHDKNTTIGNEICEKYNLDGLEVTNDVFNSKNSVVFSQAENRMHTIKAIISLTI